MTEPQPQNALHARDVLDEAVRRLAVSDAELITRVRASVKALTKLTAEDFSDSEDRELLTRIQRRTYELALAEAHHQGNGTTTTAGASSSSTLEAIAGEVLDLRDNTMGRALRQAWREGQTRPMSP